MAFDDRQSPSDQGSSGSPVRRKRWRIWAALAACLVIAGLVVAAVRSYGASHRDDLSNARVGDCVAKIDDYTRDVPYELAGCADSAAGYRLLAVEPRKSGGKYCHEVAGASLLLSADEKVLCLGKKDVDPAKAVNVAKEGDCLYLELPPRSAAGLEPVRLDCVDPQANLRVLSRRTNQSTFDSESDWCKGVDRPLGPGRRVEHRDVGEQIVVEHDQVGVRALGDHGRPRSTAIPARPGPIGAADTVPRTRPPMGNARRARYRSSKPCGTQPAFASPRPR